MAKTLTIKKGDTQTWEFTLKQNGSAVENLEGAGSVKLYMRQSLGSVNKINGKTCTVIADGTDALEGRANFEPVAADVDTAGFFDAYFLVTWGDASTSRFPSNDTWERAIHVTENLE